MNVVDRLCDELHRRGVVLTPEVLRGTLTTLDMTLVEGQRANVNRHLERHAELGAKVG